jgi:hypothetical protein
MEPPDESHGFHTAHARFLIDSYHHWTGLELITTAAGPVETARRLYLAPFALVSHGTGLDPPFNYGNETALRLFEMSWDRFTRTPSRQSAELSDQRLRAELMTRVIRDGFMQGYSGIRVSSSGRRFRIDDAVIWNLLDETGSYCGQAAYLSHWQFL